MLTSDRGMQRVLSFLPGMLQQVTVRYLQLFSEIKKNVIQIAHGVGRMSKIRVTIWCTPTPSLQ